MSEREKILSAGVANLKEFGYPSVSSENILTDRIYSAFFKSMLERNLGSDAETDELINGLVAEIETHREPQT